MTDCPVLKFTAQVEPQLMPIGELVTVPEPVVNEPDQLASARRIAGIIASWLIGPRILPRTFRPGPGDVVTCGRPASTNDPRTT